MVSTVPSQYKKVIFGINKRRTGLENGMENGTENGFVEDLTVIYLSKINCTFLSVCNKIMFHIWSALFNICIML